MTVREEIANFIASAIAVVVHEYRKQDAGFPRRMAKSATDQIFSIKVGERTLKELIELQEKGKLLVMAENQELPPFIYVSHNDRVAKQTIQDDMLKEGWVKCKKEEQ